jgi:Putative beta-barrel porin-2, OmpL-like. bbp2
MKTKLVLFLAICGIAKLSSAQDSTTTATLKFSAYVEAYYSNDLANPADHLRPGFFYSYNRHNEVALNLGYLKAAYATDRVRGNLALMTGTYAQYNLAAEPALLRHIYEANAGIKLSRKQDIWLDLGVLPSHIGFESAVGKDCWTLSRSLLAENSPYYETGARLSINSNDGKWYAAALLLNGWQRMTRVEGIQSAIFGTQLTYKPSSNVTLNWSSYLGDERPGNQVVKRFFNNFYGSFNLTPKLGLITGFDIGVQEIANEETGTWIAPIAILRYSINDQLAIAGRAEYYGDKDEVIISTPGSGFETLGLSLNLDYMPVSNVSLRFEGRTLSGQGDYFFNRDGQRSSSNTFFTTALAIAF